MSFRFQMTAVKSKLVFHLIRGLGWGRSGEGRREYSKENIAKIIYRENIAICIYRNARALLCLCSLTTTKNVQTE